ncbi:MAG: peptidase family protein [Acidimicrobiales bacterium]|nr:peptidase family protein [Acidimicrobiales bacterium]
MTDRPVIDTPDIPSTTPPDSSHPLDPQLRAMDANGGEIAGGTWRLVLLGAAVVALGVFAGRGWLFIMVALTVMIFLHELGHFLTAKWSGMKVTQFFIGVGPKLWSFQHGETEYGFKLIPIAAYVRIIGMNNLDEVPAEDEPRTYRQQSFPKRMLVITAGSAMHFLQAFVLFLVLFSIVGVPRDSSLAQRFGAPPPDWSITSLMKDSAAAQAGVKVGDRIVGVDDTKVAPGDDVSPLIRNRAGQQVTITVARDGHELALPVTVGHAPGHPNQGLLGIELRPDDVSGLPGITTNPANAAYQSGRTTVEGMGQTVTGLGTFFTHGLGSFAQDVADGGKQADQGPVVSGSGGGQEPSAQQSPPPDNGRIVSIFGVARIGAQAGENSMGEFLVLLALVNVSIGVLNLLPLLPLDGGHAAIAIYERIRSIGRRRYMADVSRLLPFTYAVMLVGLVVGLSAIYLDIVSPIGLR